MAQDNVRPLKEALLTVSQLFNSCIFSDSTMDQFHALKTTLEKEIAELERQAARR